MDGLNTYATYLAIKNHFTVDEYDYFKYNKKFRVSENTFLKRNDKYYFVKLGKTKGSNLEDFLVANFINDPKIWVGDLISEKGESAYKQWLKKRESMSYVFKNEMAFMDGITSEEMNKLFEVEPGEHPMIIRKYLQKEISIESLIILDSILTFMNNYDTILYDPLYGEVSRLCKKYRPFITFDVKKYTTTLKSMVGLTI